MFTGIIEEVGTIERIESMGKGIRLTVSAATSSAELHVNDSVSINGVCETVVSRTEQTFTVEAVEETLKKTTFGSLKKNESVNLELPMRLNERLGGHLVLGHVDAVGKISGVETRENSWMFSITIPMQFVKYVVPVGSIGIDGVSLTVAELESNVIKVSIIPHTWDNTIFHHYKQGAEVNLEFDVVGKYIERMIPEGSAKKFFTEEQLRELGY